MLFKMEYYTALKERTTCYYTDEPWEHYVKCNKPVTKIQILYDSNLQKYTNSQIHWNRELLVIS